MMKYKACAGKIKSITEDEDHVIVEGYANYSMPDDSKERLDPQSMDDSRYVDNPILLFNHKPENVIGKTLSWERKPDGVYVKCAISKSAHGTVSYVRDLVKEGILKAFSVGFSGGQTEKDLEHAGSFLTKNWKLHELSIVPIPMQAQSTFSVTKAFNDKILKCKTLSEARIMTLSIKGAAVAAVVAPVLEKLDDSLKQESLMKICEIAGCQESDLLGVLSGDVIEVPDNVLTALSSVLGIPAEDLKTANETDAIAGEKEQEPIPVTNDETKPEEPLKPAMSKAGQDMNECVSAKIAVLIKEGKPKDQAVAQAISMCSQEKGCSPSDLSDDDWAHFLSLPVEETNEKEPATVTTKAEINPSNGPIDTGDNLHIQLLQSQLQMLGALAVKMDSLLQLVSEYLTKEVVEDAKEVQEDSAPELVPMKSLIKESRELNARLKSYLE